MCSAAAAVWVLSVAAFLASCDRAKVQEPTSSAGAPSLTTSTPVASAPPATRLSDKLTRPAPARIVAIGDLHGDLDHARRALRLAKAIDDRDAWTGGKLVVVQTGDEIDRGDDDRAILDLVEKLKTDAKTAGGEFIALLGNHEIMNASFDFRYVTVGAFAAFSMFTMGDGGALPAEIDAQARGRAAAFAPGHPYATMLARRPMFVRVGDTLFVHGGILPKHVAYGLDKMNDEVDDWLLGRRRDPPAVVTADDGPLWTRAYSADDAAPSCALLSRALAETGAARMVVGHTVQRGGVTSACDSKVWRIDVGLAHHFGGPIEAVEIAGDRVGVLRE